MSKHFTFIRKICSLIHLQYLCEERCFAIAFCEYEAYQGAASRCHISRFCQGKNISLFGSKQSGTNVIALSAEKFHVLCKGTRFRILFIAPLRRTSGCSVTLLAVLSRRICSKACVKARSPACPYSACSAKKKIAKKS